MGEEAGSVKSSLETSSRSLTPRHWTVSPVKLLFWLWGRTRGLRAGWAARRLGKQLGLLSGAVRGCRVWAGDPLCPGPSGTYQSRFLSVNAVLLHLTGLPCMSVLSISWPPGHGGRSALRGLSSQLWFLVWIPWSGKLGNPKGCELGP